MFRSHILVCGGTGCTSGNSMKIYEALVDRIQKEGLEKEVHVTKTGCFGLCAYGPIMIVYPEGAFYSQVKVEDVDEIVSEHIIKGRIVTRLLYKETVGEDGSIKALNDTNFYKKQHRVALRNCGVINPEKIEEYIAYDGYEALGKVLTEMTPQDVIDVILKSGLRGRGGAGFPTGRSGSSPKTPWAIKSTSAATPTRATPARSWTVPSSKATPTRSSRQWPSRHTPSAPIRATSTSVRNILSPCSASPSPSSRRASTACSGKIFSVRALISTSTSVWAQARSSAARKPR